MDLNGHEQPLDEVKAAQQKLAEACMKQPMTPTGCTISAFVNGAVNGATLSALVEYVTMPVEFDLTKSPPEIVEKPSWESIWLKHLTAKIDGYEASAREASRIITSAQLSGHG